ncbi:MAG: LytTR family transcriptional regulator DNA-binding domain-containing protein, partial [Bacteroidales bacterium]|jgi:DNA-binding LytR/AlgR family response regulator|nr:LytTR family transcriptional regulator DNA-binding domain-containing protein [Bacteroidales bacterium]
MKEIITVDTFDFSEQDYIICHIHGKEKEFFFVRDVLYCICEGNYITIFLNKGEEMLDRELLKTYDEYLFQYGFFRISHNTIVNGRYITAIDLKNKEKKCFLGEIELTISRRRVKLLEKSKLFLPLIAKKDHL